MRKATVAILALLAGCTNVNDACTLIYCANSLTVHLAQAPAGAYSIEVFTQPSGPHYVYNCANAAQCGSSAEFTDFTPDQATVRVTTTAGTSEQVVQPSYTVSRPNGPNCGPACKQASVTVALPG